MTAQAIYRLKWCTTFAIPSITGIILYLNNVDTKVLTFSILTLCALTLWALELLPDAIVAVALPITYIISGVGPAPRILAPWTGPVGWLVLGGLFTGVFMMKTGLARRIALRCMSALGGSFTRLLWGILLAGFILAPFIPTVLGRAAILAVICLGVCEALNLQKGSREGAALMLSGFIAVAAPKLAFATGGADLAVGIRLASQVTGQEISWMTYLLHNFIPALMYSIISIFCVIFVLRPKLEGNMREIVLPQLEKLGKMTIQEKKAAAILGVLLLIMVTDRFHGINVAWCMLLLGCCAFLPGIDLLDSDDIKKVNYPALLFVVGCMTIGSAAVACGVDKIISAALLPLLQGSEMYSVMAVFGVGIALNFLLTPLAAYSALTASLMEIAQQLNIDPHLVFYAYNYGLDQYIFPYEYAILLYFYATGYPRISQLMQVCAVRMAVAVPFVAFVAYPYWKLFV